MEWWNALTTAERTLLVASVGVIVTAVGILIAWIISRSQTRHLSDINTGVTDLKKIAGEHLALDLGESDMQDDPGYPPKFELEVDPPLGNATNARLAITCTSGKLTYDVEAQILTDFGQSPAAISLIGDGIEYLGAPEGSAGVYKRFRLGRFRRGERRMYSVQPNVGISSLPDDRASVRLIATALDGPPAGSAWQSTHSFRITYPAS